VKHTLTTILNKPSMFNSALVYVPQTADNNASSYEEMREKGFMPKHRKNEPWSLGNYKTLKKSVAEIINGKDIPRQKNHSYYIAHYKFDDTKSAAQIQYMINKRIRKELAKQSKEK